MNDINISLPLEVAKSILDTLEDDSPEYFQLSEKISRTMLSEYISKYVELQRKYNREIERGDTLAAELVNTNTLLASANYRLEELGAVRSGGYISPSSIPPFTHEFGYILTIKELRTLSNCTLSDAKNCVDKWIDDGLITFPLGKGRGGK